MTDSIFKKIGMVVKNYVEDIKNNLQAQINTKANQNHQHEIYQCQFHWALDHWRSQHLR